MNYSLQVLAQKQIAMVDDPLPPVVGPGMIRIKTTLSLISPGTERAFILELPNAKGPYPFLSGYCATGVVEEVGEGVTEFKPGDRVTNFGLGHRQCAVMSTAEACKVPDNVSDEAAAFGALGLICMQGIRKARIELGEPVAIIGAGPIGLVAMQIARTTSGGPVISCDKRPERLAMAKKCGADYVVDTSKEDWMDELNRLTNGRGAAVVIEATGYPEGVNVALAAAARYGRVVFLGSTRGESVINVYRDIHKKGLTLYGAHADCAPFRDNTQGFWTRTDELKTYVKLLEAGRVDPTLMITDRIDWEDAVAFYNEKILTWDVNTVGVIIRW